MATKTAATTASLSKIAANNIRAEAARRGWTQAEMARRLSMTPVTMNDRYRERVPWTLDELERVAAMMGLEVGDLLARPKGFEPLTFWLGAEHTVTAWLEGGRITFFCDQCGFMQTGNRGSVEATMHGLDEHQAIVGRAS